MVKDILQNYMEFFIEMFADAKVFIIFAFYSLKEKYHFPS